MARTIDPRLRVLYLATIAVGALLLKDLRVLAALAGAHAIAWLALGEGARALARQLVKLAGFAAFIIASYAITKEDPDVDRWVKLDVGFTALSINVGGALVGVRMIARVVLVVLASRIARSGDTRAIAEGLGRIGAPPIVATSMDAVLALLGGGGGGRGGGGGGGGGGRRRREEASEPDAGFWASLKRIARGDVGMIVGRIDRHIGRVERHLEEHADPRAARHARDIAVIAGLALTMLGLKALKVLPSIPFAPGHKLVLLTPLYIVAALRTRSRAGATLTGLVMGSVAFLLGDGRYGVFEVLKHVAPGILCDLFVPLVARRNPGALLWSVLGGVMGLGRFATIFSVTLLVQAPAVAWAILVPGLLIHTTFGVLSGLVSAPLIRAAAPPAPIPSEEPIAIREEGRT